MWKKLNPERKVWVILMGLLAFLVLAYQLSFKTTFNLYQENEHLKALNQKGQAELLGEIAFKTRQKKKVDSLKNRIVREASLSAFTQQVFEYADKEKVRVVELTDWSRKEGFFLIKTEGKYIPLIRFLRTVEQNIFAYQIHSVKYQLEMDRRTKNKSLAQEIVFERVVAKQTNEIK